MTTPTSLTRSGNGPQRSVADEEDLADLALLGAPAQLHERGVEALDVADRGAHARLLARGDDLVRLGDGAGERLLDEHVHAGRGERPRDPQVLVGRHRDDREVRLAVFEQLVDRRVDVGGLPHCPVPVAAGVDRARERDRGRRLQQPRVMAAHHPEADDGASQVLDRSHAANPTCHDRPATDRGGSFHWAHGSAERTTPGESRRAAGS